MRKPILGTLAKLLAAVLTVIGIIIGGTVGIIWAMCTLTRSWFTWEANGYPTGNTPDDYLGFEFPVPPTHREDEAKFYAAFWLDEALGAGRSLELMTHPATVFTTVNDNRIFRVPSKLEEHEAIQRAILTTDPETKQQR